MLDTGFVPPINGFDNFVWSLAWQPDGKVLAGGAFLSYGSAAVTRVARLNASGSLDASFAPPGTGPSATVYVVAAQPADGKVLVGGLYSKFNGSTPGILVRLLPGGALDNTATPVPDATYTWRPGITGPTYSPDAAGGYF